MLKKDKHKKCTGANYFYYVCPEGLISKTEIDSKYGLIYIKESGHVSIEKKPKRLHDNKFVNWKMLANKMYWKWYVLWQKKWVDKEISRGEYLTGFNIELSLEEILQ